MNFISGVILGTVAHPVMLIVFLWVIIETPKKWRQVLPFYILNIAIISYSFIDIDESDLYRYYLWMDQMKDMSFRQALFFRDNYLFAINIVLWVIAKSGEYSLLPAVASAIVYGVGSYITCDTAVAYRKERDIPKLLLIQFMLLPYISVINNIRNVSAFALVLLAVYRDVMQKRLNITTLLLYIVPCFIHSTALILILLRILLFAVQKFKILVFALTFSVSLLVGVLYNNASRFSSIPLIYNLILNIYHYTTAEYAATAYGTRVSNSDWFQVFYYIVMVYAVIVLSIIIVTQNNGKNELTTLPENKAYLWERGNRLLDMNFLLALVILASSIFKAPHYWRMGVASTVLVGNTLIQSKASKAKYGFIIRIALWCVACLYFLLMVFRYRRYISVVPEWATNWLMNNPIVIVFSFLRGLLG